MSEKIEYKDLKVTPVVSREFALVDIINSEKNTLMTMSIEGHWYEKMMVEFPKDTQLLAVVIDKKKKMETKERYVAFLESWLEAVRKGEEFKVAEIPAAVADAIAAE